MSVNAPAKIVTALLMTALLTGCVGAVVGVAVDTTATVVKAPFQVAGAVVGVAASTTGAVIAAPFRVVDAAFGGEQDHQHSHHHEGSENHSDHSHDRSKHEPPLEN